MERSGQDLVQFNRMPLHSALYDFNDDILPIGARYFAELIRQRLPLNENSL